MNTEKNKLRKKILNAGVWTLGGHAGSQLLRLISNLFMTRLLMPESFGIMAIANSIILGLALFSDLGLGQSIVHNRRGGDVRFINTVWTIQILRSLLITFAGSIFAVTVYLLNQRDVFPSHSVYTDPILPAIIFVLSFGAIISGFDSTKIALASRNMALGRVTAIELTSQLGALAIMIVLSFFERSIWVLVIGSLASAFIRASLSHFALPGERNRLCWDKSALRDVLNYGGWIFITSILGFLAAYGDRLLLAAMLDPKTMGMYAIASYLIASLHQVFTKIGASVCFPAFCEITRNNPKEIRAAYYKFRMPLDIVALILFGLIISQGHLAIKILYDTRYYPAGHILEVLSLAIFEVRFALIGHYFMAIGQPKLLIPNIAIRIFSLFILMPIAYNLYGAEGAIWLSSLAVTLTIPMSFYLKYRYKMLDIKRELVVLPAIAIGLILGWAFEYGFNIYLPRL